MGGKSFYCDYCCCYLKNDVNVRKIHNAGLVHNMAKTRYMQRYADPRKVLAAESSKLPCKRYLSGAYCKFDLYCQYSHFSQKQISQLRKIANRLEQQKQRNQAAVRKPAEWTKHLPWNLLASSGRKGCRKRTIKHLPQSLKPINFNKLAKHCEVQGWG